jgi:hypothetical protein
MRKNGFSVIVDCALLCLALLLFSCNGGKEASGVETAEEAVTEEDSGAGAAVKTPWSGPNGVILATAYLWELRGDGIMYSVNKVRYAGDAVGWKDETITAKRNTDNLEREFRRIDSDGEDLWAQSYAAAGPAVPGIVLGENTLLYTRPDLAAPASGWILSVPQYTLAAVFPEMDMEQFIGISAYVENTGVADRQYVKRQNISTDPSDVKSMQLYQLALDTAIGVRKRELLNNALEISGSFSVLINKELHELEGVTGVSASFTVTEDNVNIRDRPDTEGEKTGTLQKGETVAAFERTNAKWQAGGKTDYWYRTREGWVFGAYLKKTE